jgi:ubiquinone biosynthesis monooxygenase Coq6
MATLVENLNLQHSLLTLIRNASSNVDILGSTKVEEIERVEGGKDEWPTVRLSGGKEIKARLVVSPSFFLSRTAAGQRLCPNPSLPSFPSSSLFSFPFSTLPWFQVGADGLRSPVRKFAGIDSHGHSYNTHTIVSILTHDPYPPPPTPHTHTAYQRFLPSGPLAFLPLTDTQASLAWHINPPELSLAVKSLPEETLALMINACFRLPEHGVKHLLARVLEAHQSIKEGGKAISKEEIMSTISLLETSSRSIEPHSPLSLTHPPSPHGIPPKGFHLVPPTIHSFQPGMTASFPLSYSHAESYVLPRVALVGDAAHTVHPHAGMGLNMGLADVRSLTKHLEGAVGVGGDLGSMVSLKGYERERWVANQAVLTATDGLEKMFRTQNSAVRWVRSMGIDVLEELEGVKGLIMKGRFLLALLFSRFHVFFSFGIIG